MMLTESIQKKIQELFDSTPDNVGVSYGKKKTNGQFTGEIGITFLVEIKRPLEEIPADQILPSSVTIDGVEYVTDVLQVGEVRTIPCDPTTLNNCYGWITVPPDNKLKCRPLKGGVAIASFNAQNYGGTLGFIAVDIATQSLVGVSNNHVLILDNFYTSSRDLDGVVQNEVLDDVYQPGFIPLDPINKIGQVLRYAPLLTVGANQVDGALLSILPGSEYISNTESFKQFGLSYNLPMPFATTEELNNLLIIDPPLYSSGLTSGAKGEGVCGLTISQIAAASNTIGFRLQGVERYAYFNELLVFTRSNPDCPNPVTYGDSGSALIASFGGVWKIIGLVYATSEYEGYACRIDNVAAQLGIEAWDGSPKNFINPASIVYKTTAGGSSNRTLNCDSKTYWQVGLINALSPCSPITSTTTTTTFVPGTTTTTTTAALVYKPFTWDGTTGSLVTACAKPGPFTVTSYFTGPGTYPTTGDRLYFQSNGGGNIPFQYTGWLKMSNGHAIQGSGNSIVVADDVNCSAPITSTTTTTTSIPTTTTTTTGSSVPAWYTMTSCIGAIQLKSSVSTVGKFAVGQVVVYDGSSFATITGSLSTQPSGVLYDISATNLSSCPTIINITAGPADIDVCSDTQFTTYLDVGINTGATTICNATTIYAEFDLVYLSGTIHVRKSDQNGVYKRFTVSQDGKSATAVGFCENCTVGYKPFTLVSAIVPSSAQACPLINYSMTWFFTGPGIYPTVGNTIYNQDLILVPLNNSWIKISNGRALQGNSLGVITNDINCTPTTTTTTTQTPTTTTTTTGIPGPTTTTTTTPAPTGIYTLYEGFLNLNTTWVTFN